MAEDVSFAFMLALDRLTPAERAAFLLHDVLDVPFDEIAVTLARSEPAVRRWRRADASMFAKHIGRVRRGATKPSGCDAHFCRRFAMTTSTRSKRSLQATPCCSATAAGKRRQRSIRSTARIEIAAFIAGIARKYAGTIKARNTTVNGAPGLLVSAFGVLLQTLALEIEDGVIRAVYVMRNPDKLRGAADRFGLVTEDRVPGGTQRLIRGRG